MPRLVLWIVLVAPLGSLACSGSTAGGAGNGGSCTSNDECSAGSVCDDGGCYTVCRGDRECGTDEICTASLCRVGDRPGPQITGIDGDGVDHAECLANTNRNCIGTGLLIEGENLEGADFTLTPEGGGAAFALNVRDGNTDILAAVDVPLDTPTGVYTLSVANQTGSVDQTVELIQGPPGPAMDGDQMIQTINGASTEIVSADVLPVGTTPDTVARGNHSHSEYMTTLPQHNHDASEVTSGVLDAARLPDGGYDDEYLQLQGGSLSGPLSVTGNVTASGSVTASGGLTVGGPVSLTGYRQIDNSSISTYTYTPGRFVIDATPARVGVVLPIDWTIMAAMCRDIDGCQVTIEMANWAGDGERASRRERLLISPTSGRWRFSNNDVVAVDGNSGTNEWTPWDCYLTDAETSTNGSNGRSDNTLGWGLLNVAGGSYSDSLTTCRVIIED